MEWREEIQDLPFQPEEEDILNEIIEQATKFREFVRPFINPVVSSSEELSTHRFYLRKIEGAEILLTSETNFFRQEVHRWAPVAPEAPPVLRESLSTRKPRPTKQQRLMQQHNVSTPEELPLQFRQRDYNPNKARPKVSNGNATIAAAPSRRPRSSHSTPTSATGSSRNRFPPHISTSGANQSYSSHYPLSNSRDTSGSPALAQSPYYSNGQHPQSPFTESPTYGHTRSPLSGTYPMDPTLDSPFGLVDHPHGRINSPRHNYSSSSHSHPQDSTDNDNLFEEYVDQPDEEDELNQGNEVAEALEDRDREQNHPEKESDRISLVSFSD